MLETLFIITEQVCMHFPLIIGSYISLSLMKVPDLSIESAYVCGAFLGAKTISYLINLPFPFSLLVIILSSFIGGAFVGFISSILTHITRIPHLLSSIITIGIFHGILQLIAGVYASVSNYPNFLEYHYIPLHPELPLLLVIFLFITLMSFYVFKTQLGYSFAIFGDNPSFFTNYKISKVYVGIMGIVISNGFAGISGYLSTQCNGFADISMGFGKLLLCITTLILGKVIEGKNLSIITPISGIFCYFILQQLLLKIGFDLRYFTMIQALVILAILIFYHRKKDFSHNDHLGI